MDNGNEYENIARIIKEWTKAQSETSVLEVINFSVKECYDRPKVESVIKRLIRLGQLSVEKSHFKAFGDQLVKWDHDSMVSLPQKLELDFKELKFCLTLPAFNIYGLTDFLTNKQVEINVLKKEFEDLFQQATSSIKICSPFLDWNGYHYFHKVLISKARKGVNIQVLSREIKKSENLNRYETLKKINALFENQGLGHAIDIRNYYFLTEDNKLASSIHAKLMIIDNCKAYLGSGEIRENSFTKNLEIGIVLKGEKVQELTYVFDNLFSKSEVIDFD